MGYRYLYHRRYGGYLPAKIIYKGTPYYDPFSLTVHMNDQVFDPDSFPEEYVANMSWRDFLHEIPVF